MGIVETSENAKNLILQTHYYKATYEQIKNLYLEIVEGLKHKIISVNDDFGEICSELPHMSVVAKIINLGDPLETSIDFYIASEYLVASNKKATKFIDIVLKKIEEKYPFKGVSLHQ